MATSIQSKPLAATPAATADRARGEKSAAAGGTRISSGLAAALIVLAGGVLPFLPALRYGFVYDDDWQVVRNVAARAMQPAWTYFVTSIWSFRDSVIPANYNYYRPLFQTWLRVNGLLFGQSGFWWHLSAIVAHLAVCLLVFALIRRYVANPWAAMFGALVFAVHPARNESVVWVSGADDPLMTLGVLGGLLLWLRSRERKDARGWLMAGSLACYAAALLCKETGVVLPALIFAYVALGISGGGEGSEAAQDGLWRRLWPAALATVPYAAVTAAYVAARFAVLHSFRGGAGPWIGTWQALLNAPAVLLFYMRHVAWPVGMHLYYDFPLAANAASGRVWLPLLADAAIIAALAFCARRLVRTGAATSAAVRAAAVWMALPLLPVLDIRLLYRDDFVHDRYLYEPCVGVAIFCAILASAAMDWVAVGAAGAPRARRRQAALALASVVLASLAGATLIESAQWADNFSLYEAAAKGSTNPLALTNYAGALAGRGRFEEAGEILAPVAAARPGYWLAIYNLGYVDYRLRRVDQARLYLDRAISLDPTQADEYLYRGLVALLDGKPEDAIAQVRRAIQLDPKGEGYHFALGVILERSDPDASIAEFHQELSYHPGNALAQDHVERLEKSRAAKSVPSPSAVNH